MIYAPHTLDPADAIQPHEVAGDPYPTIRAVFDDLEPFQVVLFAEPNLNRRASIRNAAYRHARRFNQTLRAERVDDELYAVRRLA